MDTVSVTCVDTTCGLVEKTEFCKVDSAGNIAQWPVKTEATEQKRWRKKKQQCVVVMWRGYDAV